MIAPLWKVISLILELAVFLLVGTMALMNGENLLWVVVKSIVAFVVCFIMFGVMGNVLGAIISANEDSE